MNFSDFITNHGKRVKKEAFIHLVNVSRVDGKITSEELGLLHGEGKKFGLTDPEIDRLIESEREHHYHPPYALEDKFDHLYNIAELILSDNEISQKERKLIRRFAIEAGFSDEKIDELIEIIINGIRQETDEDELFRKFKTHLFN
jgi:uncharacterized tellurite resistance protein B-like protein